MLKKRASRTAVHTSAPAHHHGKRKLSTANNKVHKGKKHAKKAAQVVDIESRSIATLSQDSPAQVYAKRVKNSKIISPVSVLKRRNATTTVFVNNVEIQVPSTSTVFQACELAGVEVPRFCFQERLSVAGNCRMCLVEVERVPKPVASCAYPLMPNMRIKTDTPMVKKAREGVLEFILANHPLDCPICDQGGECDLQDQTMEYGTDKSRFREIKRSVEDKYIGPVIKTVMTRCINCTRCVRFAEEVAGVPTLGVTGRGNNAEIGTYVAKNFDSELSGNAVDLCPVGALTNHAYAFKARPWELESTHSIDVSDALGTNIRLDSRGTTVLRALPRTNDAVNEEWMSDKARMSIDGLQHQRLDAPIIRDSETGQLKTVTWRDALLEVRKRIHSAQLTDANEIQAVVGDHADAETIAATKAMLNTFGSSNTVYADGLNISADIRSHYLFNTQIANLDETDMVILVGTNPRMEAPVLNARIRKQTFNRQIPVYGIGPEADLALDMKWLGNDYSKVQELLDPNSKLYKKLQTAKKPVIIFGQGAFNDSNNTPEQITTFMEQITKKHSNVWNDDWKGMNVLQTSAARTAALDLGFVPGPDVDLNKKAKVVFLVGADTRQTIDKYISDKGDQIVIYQGSHGDMGAEVADIILPATAYAEKQGTYVNTEGRPQKTNKAVTSKGDAKDDWQIVRAMSEVIGAPLNFDNIDELHGVMNLVAPHISKIGQISKQSIDFTSIVKDAEKMADVKLSPGPLRPTITNHFFTDAIGRASPNMARLSKELPVSRNSYKNKIVTVSSH